MTDPFAALQAAASAAAAAGQALQAQVAALQAQVASQAAEIAQLEAQLQQQAPVTAFGLDVSTLGDTRTFAQIVAAHRALAPLTHVRVFSSGNPPARSSLTAVVGDRPVSSFKTWNLAAFNAWMGGITGDEEWACYFHEPEDDAKKSGDPATWIKNYLSVYAAMDAARKAHPNGAKVRLVKILMWYQEVPAKQAGATWAEFHGGQSFVDAFGWDCYSPTWSPWDTRYATPQELFDPAIAASKATGIPWAVTELGAVVQSWDANGAARGKAITAWCDYAKANGALWVNWWCSAGNAGTGEDYHLEHSAPSLAAWQAIAG